MDGSRAFKQLRGFYELYGRFELMVSAVLLISIAIVILYSIVVLATTLFSELTAGVHLADGTALKDTFGLMLSILILIEFNHSIVLSMRQRAGVLQVRVIVMIAIIVIARKLILLDYSAATWPTMLGLGGLAVALGTLYWLLSDINHRSRAARLPEE